MIEKDENIDGEVLCAGSYYAQKYYLADKFKNLPTLVKKELKVIAITFLEEVGGVIIFYFDNEGDLQIETRKEDADITYDEILSGIRINQLFREKEELFKQLELYYKSINNIVN